MFWKLTEPFKATNTPDFKTDIPPVINKRLYLSLKCSMLPIASPMLKSASEFLNDSGRKAPVKIINKSSLFDCRIFSEKWCIELNLHFFDLRKLLYHHPESFLFVWLCPSRGSQLPCQLSSGTKSPKSYLWRQNIIYFERFGYKNNKTF